MAFVKRNQEIIAVIVILWVMLITMYIERQNRIIEQQELLLTQQSELIKRSANLDLKIIELRRKQDNLDIPIISPNFLKWWNEEEKKAK